MADNIETIKFDCPGCGGKFDEPLSRFANDPGITCPACGKHFSIQFYPTDTIPPEEDPSKSI